MRHPSEEGLSGLLRIVAQRAAAPPQRPPSVWPVLGAVGWSFVVPMLLGIAFGRWLDRHLSGHHVWTLTFMGLGVAAGGMNVWRWIVRTGLVKDEQDKTKP